MPCGIAGFAGKSDRELLGRMIREQRHRGPDSDGYYETERVGLGAARLRVIDLPKSDQPIHNEDESVWIVYNGEIYNYQDLRRELLSDGHRFYTDGDTEMVVHAYEKWGTDCLQRFRGMFAFAVWDSKKKLLFVARDRFGKKPVYYSLVGRTLYFASEIKGILQAADVPRDLDWEAADLFFSYYYIPAPHTIWKSVRNLPAGHFLTYDGEHLSISRYWDMAFRPVETTESAAIESLYGILKEAVRIRMRSDVPLGSFLSGGIDSGVVTSLMGKSSDIPTMTCTIGFEENDENLRYGRMVSEFLHTDHREHLVDSKAIDVLPKLIWHLDQPFADPSFVPTYYLSKATRERVTVALTGDGGDEMFMGYGFLSDPPMYGVYSALPKPVRNFGLRMLTKVPGTGESKRMAAHALDKEYGNQSALERYALRMTVFTPKNMEALYSRERLRGGVTRTQDYMTGLLGQCDSRDELDVMTYATIRGYLSDMILTKVDRMAMAVSLEPRAPLLDHVLAEFVGSLPSSLKRKGATSKYLLKRMALEKGLLPKEVINRRKVGFGPPLRSWLGKEWKDYSTQVMERAGSTGLFDRGYLRKLSSDDALNASKIFGIVVFSLWYSQNVLEGPAAQQATPRMFR